MLHRRDQSVHRRLRRTMFTAFAASGIAAVIGTAALASGHRTTLFLVSTNAPDVTQATCVAAQGCGPTVTAPVTLKAGQGYAINVTGTVSSWSYWHEPCGTPESHAEFPTPGPVAPTGDDAQFRFAIHLRLHGRCSRPVPFKLPIFQINLGSGWFHPVAVGKPSKPSGNHGKVQHAYTFLVVGQGVQPQFRYNDYHPSDNNGKFEIVISEAP